MSANQFWWETERDEGTSGDALSTAVSGYIRGLDNAQSMIREVNRINARLYSCRELDGIGVAPLGSVSLASGAPITIT
jgi:hypothetical protein